MSDLAVQCATKAVKVKPFAKASLKLAKHSPELMIGAGIVGMIGGTILACRATLKAPGILEEAKGHFEAIKEAHEEASNNHDGCIQTSNGPVEYTKKDRQQDLVAATVQTGWKLVKLYAVPTIVMGTSIFVIAKGHNITMKRNAAISSALATMTAGYKEYRARVRDKIGTEEERKVFYGVKEETIEKVDEKGKIKKEKVEVVTVPSGAMAYGRVFDVNSKAWAPSPELNLTFLRCQQNYANDILNVRGHLFLNEVYDMLDLPRTEQGAIVGWVKNRDLHDGDNFVDFDLPSTPELLNIPVNFNVDGIIFDLIS